jgi:hypothetical protein
MRKFNVELNVSKLNTKKIQLSQIEARLNTAQLQLETLKAQYNTKLVEVNELEQCIKLAQTTPSVS